MALMQASFTVHPLTPASAKRAALSERVAGCIPTSLWLALQRAFLEIKLLWQLTKRGFLEFMNDWEDWYMAREDSSMWDGREAEVMDLLPHWEPHERCENHCTHFLGPWLSHDRTLCVWDWFLPGTVKVKSFQGALWRHYDTGDFTACIFVYPVR